MSTIRRKSSKKKDPCTFSEGCPANVIAVDQVRQYNEISGKMEGLLQGFVPIQQSIKSLEIAVGKFEHLPTIFQDFRLEIKNAVEKYSERLRIVELRKAKDEATDEVTEKKLQATTTQLDHLKNTGLAWLWDLLKLLIVAGLGILLGKNMH